MGMHEGILVAGSDWPSLQQALQRHCGTLSLQGEIPSAEWLDPPRGEDAFHTVTKNGRAYVIDPAMVLTSNPDLVVTLSTEVGSTVVSVGAETVSGTFWLVAATNGQLRRLHWNVRSTLTQPFDLGEALTAEGRVPLEDVDGKGLLACLAELGFDPDVLDQPVTGGERYLWTGDQPPPTGPLEEQLNAHHKRFQRAEEEDWTKHIKAVPRGGGGVDIQYQPPGERKSFFKRWFGR